MYTDTSIKIGQLLVLSGLVSAADITEAEKLSRHMQIPFGRLLIMGGCLNEETLDAALEAQKLIREGLVSVDVACQALVACVQQKVPLTQALEMLDLVPQYGKSTAVLADLIKRANIVSSDLIEVALAESIETSAFLGDIMVRDHVVPPALLPLLHRILDRIRGGSTEGNEAITEIRATYGMWQRAHASLNDDPLSQSPILSLEPAAAAPEIEEERPPVEVDEDGFPILKDEKTFMPHPMTIPSTAVEDSIFTSGTNYDAPARPQYADGLAEDQWRIEAAKPVAEPSVGEFVKGLFDATISGTGFPVAGAPASELISREGDRTRNDLMGLPPLPPWASSNAADVTSHDLLALPAVPSAGAGQNADASTNAGAATSYDLHSLPPSTESAYTQLTAKDPWAEKTSPDLQVLPPDAPSNVPPVDKTAATTSYDLHALPATASSPQAQVEAQTRSPAQAPGEDLVEIPSTVPAETAPPQKPARSKKIGEPAARGKKATGGKTAARSTSRKAAKKPPTLFEFLKKSKLLNDKQIKQAIEAILTEDATAGGELLRMLKLLDDHSLQQCMTLYSEICEGKTSAADAIAQASELVETD